LHARPRDAPTILIVEDDPLVRALAIDCLEAGSYVVREATSGEDAVAYLARRDSIDVVFTDIRLGGRLTGWDVAEVFRAWNPILPIIYTSGFMTMPPRTVPGSLFITKPYQPDEVLAACARLLALRG
jgi:CheY-like chemotaxis protein